MVYGETGTFPVYNNILFRMVSFWSRLCYSKQSKLSVTLYKVTRCMHYDVSHNFRSGWIDTLDKELSVLGLNHIWRFSGDNYTPAYIKSAVKLRVSDISLQNWATEVFSHDECFNYRMFQYFPLIWCIGINRIIIYIKRTMCESANSFGPADLITN